MGERRIGKKRKRKIETMLFFLPLNNSFIIKPETEKPQCMRMYANQQDSKSYSRADCTLPGDYGIDT